AGRLARLRPHRRPGPGLAPLRPGDPSDDAPGPDLRGGEGLHGRRTPRLVRPPHGLTPPTGVPFPPPSGKRTPVGGDQAAPPFWRSISAPQRQTNASWRGSGFEGGFGGGEAVGGFGRPAAGRFGLAGGLLGRSPGLVGLTLGLGGAALGGLGPFGATVRPGHGEIGLGFAAAHLAAGLLDRLLRLLARLGLAGRPVGAGQRGHAAVSAGLRSVVRPGGVPAAGGDGPHRRAPGSIARSAGAGGPVAGGPVAGTAAEQ